MGGGGDGPSRTSNGPPDMGVCVCVVFGGGVERNPKGQPPFWGSPKKTYIIPAHGPRGAKSVNL